MPFFTVTSPSGRQFDIDATSEDHANDYVARRFFSGMEASGGSVDEPDARLIGPFGPPPKQEQQQRPSWQEFADTLAPPAPRPEEPQVPSQPLPRLSHVPWSNRVMPSGPSQSLARLRASSRASALGAGFRSPDFLMKLKGYK